jgi:CBS domain-containing protein
MIEKKLIEITAQEIMTRNISVILPTEKVTTAEIRMIKKNIGGLPVISEETQQLIGIITQRDIQLSRAVIGTNASRVVDLYSKNPVTAKKDEKLPQIIKKMRDFNIERIPIIDDNKKVVGIIVMSDIINILGNIFEAEDLI